MTRTCHICGSDIATNGSSSGELVESFECADCGNRTCIDCKSIGIGRGTDHCQRCRG